MDTGIFSGMALLDQRLTRVFRGQQDALLAGFEPEGSANRIKWLHDLHPPRVTNAPTLILATDTATAVHFNKHLLGCDNRGSALSVGGGDHA